MSRETLAPGFLGKLAVLIPAWQRNTHPGILGVVTANADGLHTPEDIERVALALLENAPRPVLGSRPFANHVPLRSRVGNIVTRQVVGFLTGTRLIDTQAGLRGLPGTLLPHLLLHVDGLLSLASFSAQRTFVFRQGESL